MIYSRIYFLLRVLRLVYYAFPYLIALWRNFSFLSVVKIYWPTQPTPRSLQVLTFIQKARIERNGSKSGYDCDIVKIKDDGVELSPASGN